MGGEKRVLILGAGFMQGRAIDAAHRKGWKVVVVDGNPRASCASRADIFEPIDLKDKEKIAEFALNLKKCGGLDGIFTCATDFSLSVAWAARECGLPSHSVEAAAAASDKVKMREIFAAASVPSPGFIVVEKHTVKEAGKMLSSAGISFPVVTKPADNMGARGCKKVEDESGLIPAIEAAVSFSRTGRAVVEEFMDGPEFSLEALVFDGQFHETGFADRHIFFPPYFIETGHTIPSGIPVEQQESAVAVFKAGVKALGLDYGAVKGDIKITEKGPMVGEIAGRLSGGYMSGWTFPYSSGIDLTSAALDLCVGLRPASLKSVKNAVSAERAWISVPGTVASVSGVDSAEKIPGVKDVFPLKKAGDAVVFPRSNVEKCGNCISAVDISAAGYRDARDKAVSAAEEACRKIILRLSPRNRETENFLFRYAGGFVSDALKESGLPEDSFPENGGFNFPPPCFHLPFREILGGSYPSVFSGGWMKKDFRTTDGGSRFSEEIEIPGTLENFMETVCDWHGRNILSSLIQAFETEPDLSGALRPSAKNDKLLSMKYWIAFLRGGIQGLLYVYDCI